MESYNTLYSPKNVVYETHFNNGESITKNLAILVLSQEYLTTSPIIDSYKALSYLMGIFDVPDILYLPILVEYVMSKRIIDYSGCVDWTKIEDIEYESKSI